MMIAEVVENSEGKFEGYYLNELRTTQSTPEKALDKLAKLIKSQGKK